ncbi:hypothetical protein FB567DRAFT_447358 [Paraphoma chrysanthemicola]|uniref:Rad51-like C-terminal domain-containing protein n=1 Tax=Paraphoma chrysanthemicola TaxID=798071 RepID=A0A8K0VW53_9PLEO|nr:hypothetical protein FB567DRAFT_447358 [Paraphoma chrysanthemicola]
MSAAEAVLASALLGEEDLDGLIDGVWEMGVGKGKEEEGEIGTGVKSVDDALGGGVRGGRVMGVWGESGGGGMDVCRALLVDALLKRPEGTAAVVDTTGNFDVLKLYTLIVSRLQRDAEVLKSVRVATGCGEEEKVEEVAAKVLDHVKIMRVFDFVGVREAIGEIRDDLEGRKPARGKEEEAQQEPVAIPQPPEPVVDPEPQPVPKRTVVQDSEDEDEDDDEEMLFNTSTPPAPEPLPPAQNTAPTPSPPHQPQPNPPDSSTPNKPSFILIDNLTQVLTPLLKKDSIQAHALATTFLHTLNHLTATHNLHTILLNPATLPRATSPSRKPTAHPQEHRRPDPPPSPSIFASQNLVPSLVGVLGRYVDTGILVGRMPRRKMDARVYYREMESGRLRGVEMVGVLEVMWDRWEGRVGKWGVLGMEKGG